MSKELHEYHYEFVSGRPKPWRVGDYEDDMVADFSTEEEARTYVDKHNSKVRDRFGENQT